MIGSPKLISKNTIVLDSFPAIGHFNGFFNLAKWLKDEAGYRIVFIGDSYFQGICVEQGFEYFVLPSFFVLPEEVDKKAKGGLNFLLNNLQVKRDTSLKKQIEISLNKYRDCFDLLNPNLVLLDDHYATKSYFYEALNVPVVLVSTMVSPYRRKNVPPFFYDVLPSQNLSSNFFCDFLWTHSLLKIDFYRKWNNFLCNGKTNLKFYLSISENSKYLIDFDRSMGVGIKSIPMIGLYPKSFDFQGSDEGKELMYFETLPEHNMFSAKDSRTESVLNHLSQKECVLIYCSLGTVDQNFKKKRKVFFKKVIKLAYLNKNCHFILSVGDYLDVNSLPEIPNNVTVFKKVPQILVLNQCDVMITHGGLNSIKECIITDTPMLVCPLTFKWDQPGNAARVRFNKIGESGNILRSSSAELNRKLNKILANIDYYRSNILRIKEDVKQNKDSNTRKIIDTINRYANNNS